MPTLATSPRLRLVTLCVLYLAQGIPWGFVAIALPPWLAEHGLSSSDVGSVLALATLPWTFKWAAGPVIDTLGFRAMGRRRPWILLAQGMMALTIGAMILIPDLTQGITALGWMIFVHNCFNALQDVSVDALAVDLLTEKERGTANGLMYGSKYVGGWVGGAGLATVMAGSGMRTALVVQTAALLGIMAFPLLLREREGERLLPWSAGKASQATQAVASSAASLFRDLLKAFSLRTTLAAVALALTAYLGAGVLSVVGAVFFTKDLGWAAEAKAQWDGWAVWLGLLGSVAGGWLADRFGAKRIVAAGTLGLAAVWLVFALLEPYWTFAVALPWRAADAVGSAGMIQPLPVALILLEPLLQSTMSVGLFAMFMAVSWPRVAATQFTAYMAMMNLSTTVGHWIAGPLDEALDYQGLYLAAALLQATAPLALLWWIDPAQTRRELGDGSA